MKIRTMTSLMALAVATGFSISAAAQEGAPEDQVVSVYERYRPDYSAPGARSGSFIFTPRIDAFSSYNTNIFSRRSGVTATSPGEVDDFIWQAKPGFALSSDWNRNFFQLYGDADIAIHTDNGSEDYEDFTIGAVGRVDMERGMAINYSVEFSDLHEERAAPDTQNTQAEQTDYTLFVAKLGFVRDQSILSLAVDGEYEKRNFDDVALFAGGVFNNDDRDREVYRGSVRVGYELDQYYEAFVRVSANRVEYDNSQEDGGPQRNSDGWEIVAGAAFDITGTSQGEIFGGYIKQTFDSDSLSGIDDFTFGGSLLWNPSGLTSVRGSIIRSVTETALFDENSAGLFTPASGVLDTLFSLQIEHELQRNVLLRGSASYTRSDYQNVVREDDIFNATLAATYLLNRNYRLEASYDFNFRDTTTQGFDFKRHIFMVGLKAAW